MTHPIADRLRAAARLPSDHTISRDLLTEAADELDRLARRAVDPEPPCRCSGGDLPAFDHMPGCPRSGRPIHGTTRIPLPLSAVRALVGRHVDVELVDGTVREGELQEGRDGSLWIRTEGGTTDVTFGSLRVATLRRETQIDR